MLGWIVLFCLMTLLGVITATESATPAAASVATSLVFSVLLVTSILLRAMRGRA